ncbi:MAG: NADH-quinone oxidoreductase subunit J [Candidatus Eisenbacteria bacterium]|nr:NADH-quinone oxidoreductase subunit J [Candidatus Eisenbacteria bacterium]
MTTLLFVLGSIAAIVSALSVVTRRNPVHSALSLIVCLLSVALLFLLLGAQFVAAIQVIVYAGAIVVLFLFVVMLLNVKDESAVFHSGIAQKLAALALVFVILVQVVLVAVAGATWLGKEQWLAATGLSFGTVQSVGRELFARYLFQFEVVSVLLLVAIVGAVTLVKKKQ